MNVYITGSNGFLGKQLVKDTNSQINIDKIYCPIRNKKGFTGRERFDKIFSQFNKCKYIEINTIPLDTNIIVLNAFPVQFNNNIKKIVDSIVTPIKKLLLQASKLKDLQKIIFISTAFVQPPEPYSLNKNLFEIYNKHCIEIYNDILNSNLTWKIIKKSGIHSHFCVNTYIYSKILTENICSHYCKQFEIPLSILRPSQISLSTCGKYGSNFGSMAYACSLAKPLLRVFLSKNKQDQIPVDVVSSVIIEHYNQKNNKIVYLTSNSNLTPRNAHAIINKKKFVLFFDNKTYLFYICRYFELFIYQILTWFGFITPKQYYYVCLFYINYDYFHFNKWNFESNYPIKNITNYLEKGKKYVYKKT